MNFITDTVYFYHNLNLTKEDKDIKEDESTKKDDKKTAQKYHGKLAVIIDDCGYDLAPVRKLVNLNAPFSYAILPYKDFSSDALHVIKAAVRLRCCICLWNLWTEQLCLRVRLQS